MQRRSTILEKVVFANRNTFLASEAGEDVANQKLALAIHRQLPTLFYETKSLFGFGFSRVEIVKNKLFVELAGVFEAVFRLNY